MFVIVKLIPDVSFYGLIATCRFQVLVISANIMNYTIASANHSIYLKDFDELKTLCGTYKSRLEEMRTMCMTISTTHAYPIE